MHVLLLLLDAARSAQLSAGHKATAGHKKIEPGNTPKAAVNMQLLQWPSCSMHTCSHVSMVQSSQAEAQQRTRLQASCSCLLLQLMCVALMCQVLLTHHCC
jgi:hypothetical protein